MGLLDSIKGLFGHGKDAIDVNGDGQVNAADLGEVASNVQDAASNVAASASDVADVNNDGQVNTTDASAVVDKLKDQLPK